MDKRDLLLLLAVSPILTRHTVIQTCCIFVVQFAGGTAQNMLVHGLKLSNFKRTGGFVALISAAGSERGPVMWLLACPIGSVAELGVDNLRSKIASRT